MRNLLPSAADYPESRLFSLDILRGLDMFYLAVGVVVLKPLLKALGAAESTIAFFGSHPWEGFTLYDLIMPLFIFMCGAAIPFALGRRLVDGRPGPGYWKHVWGRVALLWVLGMLVQGNLTSLDFHKITPYNNTLQTIAVGYVAAAYVLTIRSWAVRIAIPVLLTIAYGLIVHFGGDYTLAGNVTYKFEHWFLMRTLPAGHAQLARLAEGGYTWLLPSMIFPVIALAGAFSTTLLKRRDLGEWRRAGLLALAGGASLAVGWILAFAGVRMVKHIFTVSFTLQAIGWSMLLLALLFILTDIWKLRRGTGLFLLFGQFALTAYMCEGFFRATCTTAGKTLVEGFYQFVPKSFAPVVTSIGFGLVVTVLVILRRQLQQGEKQ